MKYVILNDGETYTSFEGCAVYDSETKQVYRIRISRAIMSGRDYTKWDKGINEIEENEQNDNS